MTTSTNALGQPVGFAVPGWSTPPRPARESLQGRYCELQALDPARHVADLYAAVALDTNGGSWTYMPYGPFDSAQSYRQWLDTASQGDDPLFYAVVDAASGQALGLLSYLRIAPENGCIEIGHVYFSPRMQRRALATEAVFLLMQNAFALGYRRLEWKCDALNAPSRAAAQRFGLSYEGIFRQATVYKGRNRDTAWYAATNGDWPALQAAFLRWLQPDNFDAQGHQRSRLSDLTAPLLR